MKSVILLAMQADLLTPAQQTVASTRPVKPLVRGVAVVLGLVLIAAAGLKLYGLRVSPVPAVGSFASPRLGVAVAAWEIVLGLWLIARFDALAWLAALGTFGSFAAVSGYFGFVGVANCGCFGAVKTSPWAAFGVDLAALVLLVLIRPRRADFVDSPFRIHTAGKVLAFMLAAFAVAWGVAVLAFGSTEQALAKLRGEHIGLSAGYLDFGEGTAGQRLNASIGVTNYSESPLRIYGGTSDCSCTATQNLPLTIPPGETAEVTVQLKVPKAGTGQMTRKVWLLTDSPEQQKVLFRIGCRVNG